jgi:hypothetical protein
MAEGIVDLLEVIDVREQQEDPLVQAAGRLEMLLSQGQKATTIKDLCQLVRQGESVDDFLHRLRSVISVKTAIVPPILRAGEPGTLDSIQTNSSTTHHYNTIKRFLKKILEISNFALYQALNLMIKIIMEGLIPVNPAWRVGLLD